MKLFNLIKFCILFSLIFTQNSYTIEIGNEFIDEVEPSIAVNPNDPTEAVVVWYEKDGHPNDERYIGYASVKKSLVSNLWGIVHTGIVETDLNHNALGDPVVIFLENETVYISTLSRIEGVPESAGIYLSWSNNLFGSNEPTWDSGAIFNESGDKEWLSGYYDQYLNKTILYVVFYNQANMIIVSNIEIDQNDELNYSLDTLDYSLNTNHWPTIITDEQDTVFAFWGVHYGGANSDNHSTDIVFKKKGYNQEWEDVPVDTIYSDLWSSKFQTNMNHCTPIAYPAVSYSSVLGRIALAIQYVDTNGFIDNFDISLHLSNDHGASWTTISHSFLQDQTNHHVLPWVSFDENGALSVIFNYSESSGPNTGLLNTFVNISYDGGHTFPHDPININSDINDAGIGPGVNYEYIGLSSSQNNIYAAYVQYGEQTDPPENGSNIKFVNWENIQPQAPFIANSGYTLERHPFISWDPVEDIDLFWYRIYRKLLFDETLYYQIETVDRNVTHFIDNLLFMPNERQDPFAEYMVKSIDASGWISGPSNIVLIHVDDFVDDGLGKSITENSNLLGVFPNPFNPNTNIGFEIESRSLVTINIFDIRGRLVESILNSYLEVGTYLYKWDASNFAAGTYLLNISSKENNITYKIFLEK